MKKKKKEIFGKFYENKDSWNNLYLSAIVAILLQFYHSLSQLCDKEMFKKKSGEKWVEERVILRQLFNCDRHCESLLRRYR